MSYWFRLWLVAYSAPSHYINQCSVIVNSTIRNRGSSCLWLQIYGYINDISKTNLSQFNNNAYVSLSESQIKGYGQITKHLVAFEYSCFGLYCRDVGNPMIPLSLMGLCFHSNNAPWFHHITSSGVSAGQVTNYMSSLTCGKGRSLVSRDEGLFNVE